jgi:branched-chain amino acid transport system substrate-binding protein
VSRRRVALPVLALLLLTACSVGPPKPAPATLEIAIDLPLTGAEATDGSAALAQARWVIDQEFGGRIEGLPIRVRLIDDSSSGHRDPVQAAHELSRALASPSLLGVIGPLDSDVAAAEIPIAAAQHLAVVSPTASNACLTKPLPECDGLSRRLRPSGPASFFRIAPADDGEAAALVRFAVKDLHSQSFAVGSDGQAYGTVLRSRFNAALTRQHEGLAYSANFDPTSAPAVDAFLAAAKQAGADTVLFAGRAAGGGCKIAPRLAAGLGADTHLLGGGGLAGGTCETDAGAAAPAVYSIREGAPEDAGLAARVLLEAITVAVKQQGGNLPTREQVRLAVSQSHSVTFDANGDRVDGTFNVFQGRVPAPGAPPPAWQFAGTA